MKKILEIKAKYDLSQEKRKEDIMNNASKLKTLWGKYKAEYIVILCTMLLLLVGVISLIVWAL